MSIILFYFYDFFKVSFSGTKTFATRRSTLNVDVLVDWSNVFLLFRVFDYTVLGGEAVRDRMRFRGSD